MTRLVNVSKFRPGPRSGHLFLNRVCASLPHQARSAIIGAPGSGKSTLGRLICGTEQPDAGIVDNQGPAPAAIGYSSGFFPHLSGACNVRLLAALAGAEPLETLAFVRDFSELGPELDNLLADYAPAMRARLGFSFSYAIPARTYLVDDSTGTGTAEFREKCDAMLVRRLESGSGLILLTVHGALANRWCDRFHGLANGRLLQCSTAAEAEDLAAFASANDINEVTNVPATAETHA